MTAPLAVFLLPLQARRDHAPTHMLLKATTLAFASTVISAISVLNFSLATLLAVVFGIPLSLAGPTQSPTMRFVKYGIYATLATGWMWLRGEVRDALWQWEVMGVWFAPLVCVLYTPLLLQAGIASLYAP